jgi:starch-binding outer membrane protein, SusD/RagB family
MKTIINTKLIGFLVIMFIGLGCTKLDDSVYSEFVANKYEYQTGDLARIVGRAYLQLRYISYANWDGLSLNDESSDDVTFCVKPWGWNGSEIFLHKHTWTYQTSHFYQAWLKTYAGVNLTNKAIEQVSNNIFSLTEEEQTKVLSELRVLRAFYYYILCDYFGNVPIVTEYSVPAGYTPQQNTRVEVYNFIVTEILESLPNLSEDKATMYGRFNKFAAYSLLARMYLNAEVYNGTQEWQKCIDACDEVIESGKYSLSANQVDCFIRYNEKSNENIFAIPFDEIKATGDELVHKALIGTHALVYRTINGGGWGGINMIPQFINLFDSDDERLKANYVQGPQINSYTGQVLQTSFVKIEPFIITNDLPSVDFTVNENDGFKPGKIQYYLGMNANNLDNDLPIFRYAMILMMKAECLLRLGNSGAAAELVTQVRTRNFTMTPGKALVTAADLLLGSNYDYGVREIGTIVNGQVKVVEDITHEGGSDIVFGRMLDELGMEFDQEGYRRQDLIRFKTTSGQSVYTSKSWLSHRADNNSKFNLFPIPQQHMQENPNLKQNPGY